MRLILASSSPRRRSLLEAAGYEFTSAAADIDESACAGLPPAEMVRELSRRKAQAIRQKYPDAAVLGADTVVAVDGRTLGKPKSPREAEEMLAALSGREHEVFSGVTLLSPAGDDGYFVRTAVRFYPLSAGLIRRYVATGEPMDKAGAYGIQGLGALLVEGIQGDYLNVVGLPVARVFRSLGNIGILPAGFAPDKPAAN